MFSADHSSTGEVIRPSDFSNRTTDWDRDTWTPAKISAVVMAAKASGERVIIDSDGFLYVNVELISWQSSMLGGGWEVIFESTYSDGTKDRTRINLRKIPQIIVLGNGTRHPAISRFWGYGEFHGEALVEKVPTSRR